MSLQKIVLKNSIESKSKPEKNRNRIKIVSENRSLTVKNMGHLPLMKRHFIEGTESQCATSVFRLFWTKQRGRLAKTVPLSLNCFFVNRCSLTSALTVKQFNTCFYKQTFLVSWAWQKPFFFNMYNVVLDVSFGSSKKVVVTKQSKTPSFETPNLQFWPLFWYVPFWSHEHFWCSFQLFSCL